MSSARIRVGVDATVFDERPSGARRRFVEIFRRLVAEEDLEEYRFYAAQGVALARFAPFTEGRTIASPLSPGRPLGRATRGLFWWPLRSARDELRCLHVHALPAPDLPRGTKVTLTIHDVRALAVPDLYSPARRRLVEVALAAAKSRVDRFIAVSEFTKKELIERAGIEERRIAVIPNAVSGVEPADPDEVRARLGLPERIVLTVSHLEPRKNLTILLPVLQSLAEETLVIVGRGPDRAAFLARAREWGVDARLRIIDSLEDRDLAALYRLATLFLFPSLYEGFGIPVLEAMAVGTPVVASAAGAIPEVAGDAAVLLPPRDPGAWVEAVRAVVRDARRREALASAGRDRAARYSWDRSARGLRALEREIPEE